MWCRRAMLVLVVGGLGVGCETPDPALEGDPEARTAPVSDLEETRRWAEEDIER